MWDWCALSSHADTSGAPWVIARISIESVWCGGCAGGAGGAGGAGVRNAACDVLLLLVDCVENVPRLGHDCQGSCGGLASSCMGSVTRQVSSACDSMCASCADEAVMCKDCLRSPTPGMKMSWVVGEYIQIDGNTYKLRGIHTNCHTLNIHIIHLPLMHHGLLVSMHLLVVLRAMVCHAARTLHHVYPSPADLQGLGGWQAIHNPVWGVCMVAR